MPSLLEKEGLIFFNIHYLHLGCKVLGLWRLIFSRVPCKTGIFTPHFAAEETEAQREGGLLHQWQSQD